MLRPTCHECQILLFAAESIMLTHFEDTKYIHNLYKRSRAAKADLNALIILVDLQVAQIAPLQPY